jgi:pyruvate-ferredoxin/flavodoxin oxidoreductase
MGELADLYSAQGRTNIWGSTPEVVELQSEAGASASVHGALQTGALTSTFTASQGLLLMLPNMFKIAGELTSTVFHIAARAVANQALSIFGDHSDVMAARSTGFGQLASGSIQEVMDNALIAQAASLESRVPFLHFFDGFRSSHEIQKVEELDYETMKKMIDPELVRAHRKRSMNPEDPVVRGTSQNPDVFFAARETVNKYYWAAPEIVQRTMDKFAELTGRQYHLFNYIGAKDAQRVVVLMGSGAETMEETVRYLADQGEKVGVLKVRLYRPFSAKHLVDALPNTVKSIAVLDRTKESGSLGEPLYEDVRTAIGEMMESGEAKFSQYPTIVGGRYGLGSNEFNPGMAKAVLDNLTAKEPKNHFTIGIHDDKTNTSLEWDPDFSTASADVTRAMFYGLGSDGTVGANKNSIKIIGEATDQYAQGYFVYDSKKAGATTVSHLRFGKNPIKSTYLIQKANFLACHKFTFLERYEMLKNAEPGGTFLLNSPYGADEVWDQIPEEVQQQIIDKKLKFYVIDGSAIAEKAGMGGRINTVMQTAFFKISGVLPEDQAIDLIKKYVEKTYSRKGKDVVERNLNAIDLAQEGIQKVDYPNETRGGHHMVQIIPDDAPQFVKEVTGELIAGRGADLPVSKLPEDGTYPTGTTQYEKRNVAEHIPVWDPESCIQCGKCSFTCPHAVIRMKMYDPKYLKDAPETFKSTDPINKLFQGYKYTVQVSPQDCTGCGACINICPVSKKTGRKALSWGNMLELREEESKNWDFFNNTLPEFDRTKLKLKTTLDSQLLKPLFEFSGACAGCGETPYVKLVSQFFGDRAIIANATGCSSIYGGNLPTTPYTKRHDGRGPTWNNSLFEDAAEFGYGMRLTSDRLATYGRELIDRMLTDGADGVDRELLKNMRDNPQRTEEEIENQRQWKEDLLKQLKKSKHEDAQELASVADYLVRRSVWIFGGDGWAYDIGYGGLDHVLASGRDVNVLVLDTEVYSNTGGQMSKATPTGAIAKFAAAGKGIGKKDLGMMAMSYGYVYVAKVAMGYNDVQTIRAFREAEAYPGPSLIIAYSHCISHGIDMMKGMDQQKRAVETGIWPLYRYNPQNADEGKNPFKLDSKEPAADNIEEYLYNEVRYKALKSSNPDRAAELLQKIKKDVDRKYKEYKYLADRDF